MAKALNPDQRALILEIVQNQLRDGTPPETRVTFDRLVAEGHTRERAEELIACVVTTEIYDILKSGEPFNEARFVSGLHKLPQMPWEDA